MLARAIKQIQGSGEDFRPLIVPVPLHAGKRGERGFHQAALIVRAAVKCLPQPMEVASGLLQRGRPTRWQVGLSSEDRAANIRGGFRVTDPQRVKGATVIVVDDVLTTGTTGSEGARVPKKAGAERVWAATVARTLKSGGQPEAVESDTGEDVEAALAASV